MDYNKTAELIQNARKEKGLTQRELADILGITDRAVSKWERAKSFPDVSMLQPLAEALDISVTEILDGERRSNDAAVTAGEAEQAAIRGIDGYVRDTKKKSKPLWAALAVVLLILGAVAFYEYDEYRHRPLNFQEDELEFGDVVYYEGNNKVHRFELEGPFGEETRQQIVLYLKRMPRCEEVTRNEQVRSKMARIDFEGLIIFYFDCYYDYKSEKYYSYNGIDRFYRNLKAICEDLLLDDEYIYEGPLHFEIDGATLDINCPLVEKPMECIVGVYRGYLGGRYNDFPDAYSSYSIEKITRLMSEEYEEIPEFSLFEKEIAYRDIYAYRIYIAEIRYIYTDALKALGPQQPEGIHRILYMTAKRNHSDKYEIIPQYISLLTII